MGIPNTTRPLNRVEPFAGRTEVGSSTSRSSRDGDRDLQLGAVSGTTHCFQKYGYHAERDLSRALFLATHGFGIARPPLRGPQGHLRTQVTHGVGPAPSGQVLSGRWIGWPPGPGARRLVSWANPIRSGRQTRGICELISQRALADV